MRSVWDRPFKVIRSFVVNGESTSYTLEVFRFDNGDREFNVRCTTADGMVRHLAVDFDNIEDAVFGAAEYAAQFILWG